ncbi:MAG: hypothetical protein ACKOET_18810, partial [Verrucomicrobiota bacterium]
MNNLAALRLIYPSSGTIPILIGGSSANSVDATSQGSVVAGGGTASIGAGSIYGAILGGRGNAIADGVTYGGIVSGDRNKLGATGIASSYGFIGGGLKNTVSGTHTVLTGGNENVITNSDFAAIVTGDNNFIGSAANGSFIGTTSTNSLSLSVNNL